MALSTSTQLGWIVTLMLSSALGAQAADPDVTINEMRGGGGDWVELFNTASLPVDLSGLRLADSDARGRSRLGDAMRFPRGTTLAPHGYLLVVSERGKRKDVPEAEALCAPKGPTSCFKSSWKIGQKRGDTVRLVAADGRVLAEASYPAGIVARARSWARLPNGTGTFVVAEPTPGRENTAAPAQ